MRTPNAWPALLTICGETPFKVRVLWLATNVPPLLYQPPASDIGLLPLEDVSSVPAVRVIVEVTVIESTSVQMPPEPLKMTCEKGLPALMRPSPPPVPLNVTVLVPTVNTAPEASVQLPPRVMEEEPASNVPAFCTKLE